MPRDIEFCVKMYKHQRAAGRYFLHGHPWLASSWEMPSVIEMSKLPDVECVRADQCQYGLQSSWGRVGSELGPVLKPTRFMTNSSKIAGELSLRCGQKESHAKHVHLMGGRAEKAAEYPKGLCEAICRGLALQRRYDTSRHVGTNPMSIVQVKEMMSLCSTVAMTER